MAKFIFAAVLLVLASCNQDSSNKNTNQEINSIMAKQEAAWNSGDLEGFMKAYWHHDSLIFIGSRGANYGWETTLANYKKSYPNKEMMGTLKFDNIKHQSLCTDTHWVVGKWTLFRAKDTLSGHYTLVWKKMGNQWLIVSDHSS